MGTDKKDANGKLHDGNNGRFKSEGASSPTKEEAQKMSAKELGERLAMKVNKNPQMTLYFFAENGIKFQTPNEIRKGIKTLEKRLNEHKEKISSPDKYCKDWNVRSDAQKKGLLNFWEKECINLQNGIKERKERLKELGESDEKDD